jgi:hypothetical protein
MATSICIHNVTAIKASVTKTEHYPSSGREYFVRTIDIVDDNGHKFSLTLFSDLMVGLAIEMPAPVALATTTATEAA